MDFVHEVSRFEEVRLPGSGGGSSNIDASDSAFRAYYYR
jgi:hypothetical protein